MWSNYECNFFGHVMPGPRPGWALGSAMPLLPPTH